MKETALPNHGRAAPGLIFYGRRHMRLLHHWRRPVLRTVILLLARDARKAKTRRGGMSGQPVVPIGVVDLEVNMANMALVHDVDQG
jgi:hypothetical protein